MHRTDMATALIFVTALAAACGGAGEADDAPPSEVGTSYEVIREAPDFALEALSGDSIRSSDFADREAILMNFWASWCAPCRVEMPELIELHEQYDDRGLALVGVTVNDLPKDSREFAAEMDLPYPSAIGTPRMLEEYGVSPWLPTTLLIEDGKIVREWVGPKTRADFEYPIKVALDLAPPVGDVTEKSGEAASE